MNKKQLISLCCGIVAVVIIRIIQFHGFRNVTGDDVYSVASDCINVFIIGLMTAISIYSFRNKKDR